MTTTTTTTTTTTSEVLVATTTFLNNEKTTNFHKSEVDFGASPENSCFAVFPSAICLGVDIVPVREGNERYGIYLPACFPNT